MTDYFSLLGEPRRPWLDTEALQQRFLKRSADAHPDRFHAAPPGEKESAGRRYAELNAAWQTLRDPKERLLHLLELELGSRPRDVQRIPPGTMDMFVEVGQTCRDLDAFLAERAQATSPMLKVALFQRGLEWTDRVNGLQERINARRSELEAELKQLNAAWEKAPEGTERTSALPLERLEQLYRVFSYIGRWTAQLQERLVQLAL